MIRYLLDTNILSETARPKPNANVIGWIGQLAMIQLPAVGLFEVASGIQKLPPGRRRDFLENWLAELLDSACEVLPFDREAAMGCALLEAEARHQRRTVELRDLLILAIAKSRNLGVATRNVSHFRGFGVPVYDPFSGLHAL